MELPVAMLCDHAEVRDGLLDITGGGVRRVTAPSFPAGLDLTFVAIIDVDYLDQGESHALIVEIAGEGDLLVGGLTADFDHQFPLGIEESAELSCAVPLRDLTIPQPGDYEVRVMLDGQLRTVIPLAVGQVED